jgi:MFS family permease
VAYTVTQKSHTQERGLLNKNLHSLLIVVYEGVDGTRGNISVLVSMNRLRFLQALSPPESGDSEEKRDFLKLWAGQSIWMLGMQVSLLAIPLTAVITLDASAAQMGLLAAVQQAPWLVVGLFAGAWVDRLRRRPVMIVTALGSALLLSSIPAAALLGFLSLWQLCVVGFLTGTLLVFFYVAYQSYLPSLVPRGWLPAANSRLEASRSLAQIAGPSAGGVLVQLLTAPIAVAFQAVSMVVSAALFGAIRREEPPPESTPERRKIWKDVMEGMNFVVRAPIQRTIAGSGIVITLFWAIQDAIFVLYVTREVSISPALLGIILGAGAIGGLLGAALAAKAARRYGEGRTLLWAYILDSISYLLIPLAGVLPGPEIVAAAVLLFSKFIFGVGAITYGVNGISLIQAITPSRLLGRVHATRRFFIQGSMPVGALLGGFLGEAVGLAPTILVAALGSFMGVLWVAFSPLKDARVEDQDR